MDKQAIRDFFDHCASSWDAEMIKDDAVIAEILHNAGVTRGTRVLDVACGTGVLIPYYLECDAASVTAVDISPEMVKIAAAKFSDPRVRVVCGDAEEMGTADLQGGNSSFTDPNGDFDSIVVYNAFPHFPDPGRLIARLGAMLAPGGTLTVAHGMSRAMIDRHHSGSASKVSRGLMHEDELAALFESCGLELTVKISDERMYQVAGRKKPALGQTGR